MIDGRETSGFGVRLISGAERRNACGDEPPCMC
jgi:hypothetical protein